jgi:Concanavalin A-like lectin/glucanases superfamily
MKSRLARSARSMCSACLVFAAARAVGALANGVDPNNLGQGDWIWVVSSCESALGVSTPQAVIDYEASKGMQWVCVKAGDGHSSWSQWNSTIINEAHAKGMKIFAWVYVYGNNSRVYGSTSSANVAGEISVATNALKIGGDGLIIDAEIEYETNATRFADAALYAHTIKSYFPNLFLAHAPFPYISYHSGFPYVQFGTNCDAVMPQVYWGDFGISVTSMVNDLDAEWTAWQNSLTGANTNAIKPIVPIGQGWNFTGFTESAADVTNFVRLLANDPSPASRGGYHGVSYWECSQHPVAVWNGMAASLILAGTNGIAVPQGSNATFAVNLPSGGNYQYQWKFNGANLSGATKSSFTVTNAQSADAGGYSVRVSNASGCAMNYAAVLSVISPLVNSPDSILAPTSMVDWWTADGNGEDIFGTLDGTPHSGVYYANGEVGQAIHFDGASGYVKTGASALSPPWTLCLWVNRQNAPGPSAALISDTGTNILKLEQYNGTRKVGVTVQGVADYTFNYTVAAGVWTHLAFVDNGASIQLYANGVSQGSLALNFPLPRAYIGLDSFSNPDAIGSKIGRKFTDYLLGSLDDILVFHRALSVSEISAIYHAGSAGLVRAPEFTDIASAGNGQVRLDLRGMTGKNFTLYSSTNLVNWISLGAIANPTGAVQHPDSATPPQKFYRVTQP